MQKQEISFVRTLSHRLSRIWGGYRRLGELIGTYALPNWKTFLLLGVLNLMVFLANSALLVLTAATLNVLTVPEAALHAVPKSGAFNLTDFGNWAYLIPFFGELHTRFQVVMGLAGMALAVGVAKSLLSYASVSLSSWTGAVMAQRMQLDLFRHVLTFSMGFFNRQRTGEIMSRINGDTATAMQEFASILNSVLINPLLLLFYVVLIVRTSWMLLLGIFVAGVMHYAISLLLANPIRRNAQRVIDACGSISGVLQEALTNIRAVKNFVAERIEINRFTSEISKLHREVFLGALLKNALQPSRLIINQAVQFVVLGFAVYEFSIGHIPLPTCLFFVFVCQRIVDPINQLADAYVLSGHMLTTLSRVFEFLAEKPDLVDGTKSLSGFRTALRLENVSFSYHDREPVVRNVSLEVRQGEMLALVGPSGGGKSTLTDLLLRHYDPQEGRILLDGTDVREFRVEEYRRLFGVVSQESLLFHATLRENILYGRPHLTDADMIPAARIANAQSFIEALPQGYDSQIGDRGVLLSGGQRQRIAIARAVAGHPQILLLDEATSALDSESEKEVQAAITEISRMGTSIVIAHRLSTILHADRIAFIEGGRILQVGPHEELLRTCPRYRRLCEIQFQSGSDPAEAEKTPESSGGGV